MLLFKPIYSCFSYYHVFTKHTLPFDWLTTQNLQSVDSLWQVAEGTSVITEPKCNEGLICINIWTQG